MPTPQLTLTSTEPGTEPTYTVTFDANGGVFTSTGRTTNVVYMTPEGSLNVIKEGEIIVPDPAEDGLVFDGWYLDKAFTTAYNPMTPVTANMTVYAKWKDTRMRYAVSIYGIGQDYDINGNTMGLTFGPATGADYVNSYKSHIPTETTQAGNEHRCVHDDTWDEIIYWNDLDPEVYEQCVGECCTKSVPLDIPASIKTTSTIYITYTGDGPSMLYLELQTNARIWNAAGQSYGGIGTTNYANNVNGWGGSNIRAVLNGVDDDASDGITTNADVYARANSIAADTALIAAFPQNLQEAIGYKAVKYDSNSSRITDANLKTTYDKLWLLSNAEIGTYTGYGNHIREALDGGIYQRFTENNITLTTASQGFFKGYYVANLISSTSPQTGSAHLWWLRSVYSVYNGGDNRALCVVYDGCLLFYSTVGSYGVSPCFTLSRTPSN